MSKLLNEYFFQLYKKNIKFLGERTSGELPIGQILCLHEIYNNEGLSQEKLAGELMVDKATIARCIQRLLEEGYVYRERNATDRRAYGIYLTEKARTEYADINKIFIELEDKMSEKLTDIEKIALIHLLEKICDYS